jgi:predicted DNA-binding antitoxin AbrB/MazE fold protein
MSIKVTYSDGVFKPFENVDISYDELSDIRETLGWLKTAEKSFDFWNNPDDAVYDAL